DHRRGPNQEPLRPPRPRRTPVRRQHGSGELHPLGDGADPRLAPPLSDARRAGGDRAPRRPRCLGAAPRGRDWHQSVHRNPPRMMSPATELEARWQQWVADRNRRGLRPAAWIALALYPAFGLLAFLFTPREP